ncbi:MAG: hypothetical protein JKY98_02515 [Gammaproteobacteria bacterium]|nr:hypothetical protein [Gammaproteobacteria bacterium]
MGLPAMLGKIHSCAIHLLWVRLVAVLVGAAALVLGIYLMLSSIDGGNDQLFIAALLMFCRCLLIYCLVTVFQKAPPQIGPKQGFFRRQLIKSQRALRILLALGFLVLTLSLVVMSYRLAVIGLG